MKRRHFLNTLVNATRFAGVSALLVSTPAMGAPKKLRKTPRQGEGPYYPYFPPDDASENLLRTGPDGALPKGIALEFFGKVLDEQGNPLSDLKMEIWEADGNGIYDHPNAPQTDQFDPLFKGYGFTQTDQDGAFRFVTLVPTPYTGRPPHIHVKLWRGKTHLLTTQIYIEGHADNGKGGFSLFFGQPSTLQMKFEEAVVDGKWPGQKAEFTFVL